MSGAPERLSAFGERIFPTAITIFMAQGFKEEAFDVDCMMRHAGMRR
jgi:hypothetical protein